eukprot:1161785-Pelagomonas_calceolata.AAC.17
MFRVPKVAHPKGHLPRNHLSQGDSMKTIIFCASSGRNPEGRSDTEELTQPVFTAMDAFEYPELHDESIPTNNFFRLLSKLMVASGVKDFSWRVRACPQGNRNRQLYDPTRLCHVNRLAQRV